MTNILQNFNKKKSTSSTFSYSPIVYNYRFIHRQSFLNIMKTISTHIRLQLHIVFQDVVIGKKINIIAITMLRDDISMDFSLMNDERLSVCCAILHTKRHQC